MDTLAETLLQAIRQRSSTLDSRIKELRGTVPGGDRLALARLLDLFAFFPEALDEVVDQEWQRNPLAISRVQILRPLLRHVTDVASFVDAWLGHTGTPAVPLYLLDAVERSSRSLGLGRLRAVIATGPADNFNTIGASIEQLLFRKLGPLCPSLPPDLLSDFALMRVPRLEGGTARWHPILLGHELGHLVVRERDALTTFDLQTGFDFTTASGLDVPGVGVRGPAAALRLYEIGESWAEELLCDAFAVHTFGAGAVAALGEFLEVIGATDHLSDTHPPGRLRISLLTKWLPPTADERTDNIVAPWRALAAEPMAYAETWAQFLVDNLASREADIRAVVGTWGEGYDTGARVPVINGAVESFRAGIPPEPTVMIEGVRTATTEPDVIVAAWVGRLEAFETPIDRLAEKSLTDFEFLRRWGEAGGAWTIPGDPETICDQESATLSSTELIRRMSCTGSDRLVVTPLLPGYASGASLDLRLGNTFIVFVRSTTAFLDPLLKDQDPRRVQRKMQLAWGDKFVLHPGELVLAATLEYLVMPADLSAQVVSRSSYGRLGLLTATAVEVHPHFHGCLTLELANLGTVPLVLMPGERVAQLVVSPTGRTTPPAVSKYHCPIGPEFSKVRTDDEAAVLQSFADLGVPGIESP